MTLSNELYTLKDHIAALPRDAGPGLHMETLADPALAALPELLEDQRAWRSLYIDYEPPFLMRIFLSISAEDRTIYLAPHHFFGQPGSGAAERFGLENPYAGKPGLVNQEGTNNYHPHPWASTFHIFEGSYHQHIGLAKEFGYSADPYSPLRPKPRAIWEQDANDPAKNRYTFNDPLIWHRVMPNNGAPVTSLMITYIPQNWQQVGPKPPQRQRELTGQERRFMFAHVGGFVPPALIPPPPALSPL